MSTKTDQTGFIIIDLDGLALTIEERELLRHPCIAGVILFARNYESPAQLRALTIDVKKSREALFIAVDQEGGRVQRFRDGFTTLPSMRYFGEISQQQPQQAKLQLQQTITTAARELKSVGIDINLTPVLDIDQGRNAVIGERSFGDNPMLVIELGKIVIDALHAAHMPAIGKHFPGHGGVDADSHQTLPIDQRDQEAILAKDLCPFAQLLPYLDAIMPAHVVYPAFDATPASFSRYWLYEMLRQRLAYQGIVMSDDLTMGGAAVMGGYADRAALALEAGCDLLTICNNRAGVVAVIDSVSHYRNAESSDRMSLFRKKLQGWSDLP